MTGRAMAHNSLRHSFVPSEVLELVTAVCCDRVVFHDGDEDAFPGISVQHKSGYTRGQQSIKVKMSRGPEDEAWRLAASAF